MTEWTTEIQATDPIDNELKLWQGPNIPGESIEDAIEYCNENGLGYCKVAGKLIGEIGWNSALFASRLDNNKN